MKKNKQKEGPPQAAARAPHSSPKASLSRVHLVVALILLALLAAGPYINALSNNFVLDDMGIVAHNPLIQDFRNLGKIFTSNWWNTGARKTGFDPGLYRPFTVLTYAVDHVLWKLNPHGYHLTNVLLHTATTLLLFLIAVEVLGSAMAAFAAASIFAVHPIHTEAVTGIVGRAEVLATLFFLSAFWVARARVFSGSQSRESGLGTLLFAGAAALFYLLGLFSKETAVTLPVVLLVYDRMHKEEFFGAPDKKSFAKPKLGLLFSRYAGFGVAFLIYFAFRGRAVTGHMTWGGFVGVPTDERVVTASRVLMEYLGLLVFPYTLSADYWKPEVPIAQSPFEPLVLLSLLLWIVLAVIAFYSWRKARPLFFSLAWFFITILPVSNLFLAIGVGKAERILYLPSIGFCLAIGWLYAWSEKKIEKKWIPLLPLIPILAVFIVRTYIRNGDWKDNFTISVATLKVSPTSPLINTVAAFQYRDRGELDKAIPLQQEALRQLPDYPPYYYELGLTFKQKGLLDQAIEQYRRALSLNPDYWEAHNDLGLIYLARDQTDEAVKEFNIALKFVPNLAQAHNNLGSAYFKKGLIDQAVEQYKQAISLNPDDPGAHSNLGFVYFNKNQIDDAIKEFNAALRANPDHAEAHNNLGSAYFKKGLLDQAIEQYKQALSLKPDYPDARNNLNLALQKQGAKP